MKYHKMKGRKIIMIQGMHETKEFFIEDEIFHNKNDETYLNRKLEKEMILQRRYDITSWRKIYFDNDFMIKAAQRIIWGLYYKEEFLYTFNVDNNKDFLRENNITYKTITNHEEEKCFEDYSIRIVHPIDLNNKQLMFWKNIFNQKHVSELFPQITRKVFLIEEEDEILGYVTRFEDSSMDKSTISSKMRIYDWFSTFLGGSNRFEYYKEYLTTGAECEFESFDLESDEIFFNKLKFYKMENVARDGGECYCLNNNYYINPREVNHIIFSEILYDIDRVLNEDIK